MPRCATAAGVCFLVYADPPELRPKPPHGQAAQPGQGGQAATNLATYANVRYAYMIDYPRDLLMPGREADNSDGVPFAPKSGSADVSVWGSFNANDDTPAQRLHDAE